MGFIDEARKEGYSEAEIQEYLAPKIEEAQNEGYTPEEIGKYWGARPLDHSKSNKSLAGGVLTEVQKGESGGNKKSAMAQIAHHAAGAVNPATGMEAALSLATGAVAGFPAYLLGGVGGLIAHHTYSPETDPKEIATQFAQAFTYEPRLESSRELTSFLSKPLHVLMDWSESAGKKVATATDSPVLGALTEATIQMLPAPFIGALGRRIAGKLPSESSIYEAARELAPEGAPHKVINELAEGIRKSYEEQGMDPQAIKELVAADASVLAELVATNRDDLARAKLGLPPKTAAERAADKPVVTQADLAEPESAILKRIHMGDDKQAGWSLSKLYTKLKDDLYPIHEIVKKMTKGQKLAAAESPNILARLVRGAAGKASQFLDHATFDWFTYENTGKGLKEILKPHAKELNGFRAYAVARRANELHRAGKQTGIGQELIDPVLAAGGRFKKAFAEVTQYQNELTRYLKDSGVISHETYLAMLEANKDYVPFHRFFEGNTAQGAGRGMQVRNPINQLKGSGKIVLDPLESIIKNTYLYTALAERNAVGRAFGNIVKNNLKAATDLGIHVVKPTMRPIKLAEQEIRKIFEEFVTQSQRTKTTRTSETKGGGESAGAEPTDKVFTKNKERVEAALKDRGFTDNEAAIMIRRLGNKEAKAGDTIETLVKEVIETENVVELDIRLPNDAAMIFRPNAMRPARNQIRYFEDGKAITLEVPIEVADAFTSADQGSANVLMSLLAVPAKTLRAGAILAPDFMARNVTRDQLSAFVFSKNGYIPVWDFMIGAFDLAKKGPDFQAWLKSGGANSALVSLDRAYLRQHLHALNKETGLMDRMWNVAKTPLEILRISSELMENATRLGEFKRIMRKPGANTKAKVQDAGFQSREITLDFQRIGSQTRGLNMIAAFMNASLEGLDRTARAFKDNPIGTSAKVAAGITMPSILLWVANNSTPERRKRWRNIPHWQRDLTWIIMTENHTIPIPKPFELGVIFGSSAERMLDAFYAHDPEATTQFLNSVLQIAGAPIFPTGLVPPLEQMSNYSAFRGQPLIPDRMEGILPEYQYQEYTSELTKKLGSLIGQIPGARTSSFASPIVIDNYIQGWTGTLGKYAVQLADLALRKAGVLPDPPKPLATLADIPVVRAFVVRYPSASAQSIQTFYEKHNDRLKIYNTFQHLVNVGDPVAALKIAKMDPSSFARLDGIKETLGVLNNVIRMIYRNPKITPEKKRQFIDSLYYKMIEMTENGNETMRRIDAALAARTDSVN